MKSVFLLQKCHQCKTDLDHNEQIHHCRACGQGFCDDCTQHKRPVPERGWGDDPVRVCDRCHESTTSMTGTGMLESNCGVSMLTDE